MIPGRGVLRVAVVGLLLLGACRKETPAAPVDPEAARKGRSLFQRGESVRGAPLVGLLGPERIEMSGSVAACARCHTPSGRGSQEGGVEVPDIRPEALRHPRPRASVDVEDRSRPAYGRDTLLRAITEGVSASGRPLGTTMPRYVLGQAEGEELLAYLGKLGETPDPGISPTTLTVGAALPLRGRLGEAGEDVAQVLRAAFSEVNAGGGIFRRKLELVVEDDSALYEPGPAVVGPDATTRLLERGVLALVGNLRKGTPASDARLRREGAPLVLPIALGEGAGDSDSPIFFLYPEEPVQARLVVQHLARADEERRVLRRQPLVVVRAEDAGGLAWARAAREEALRRELPEPVELPLVDGAPVPEALQRLRRTPPPAILYAGPPSGLKALLETLEPWKLETSVYAPASLAEPSVVAGSSLPVLFVYPPGVEGREAHLRAFSSFLERHGLRPRHVAFQLGAYAASRVLVEALRRSGADVTRADLMLRLEELRDFDTGVTPPVTFGVNRRVGVQGAQLVRLDTASGRLESASAWIPLSP
ncbi:ABC transporter substrate-binding protein [Vitiosangium sp. GDMCC 1.1324]|uniref:ABC transporter substrate-binding protein n=1 Tax=Vitiosangium sp. (strain GDMCC 1.1324) TaxID=2138576 RepID=UPI000D39419A|nr:ABC transporter substrate-binding protein [Vitiosangium sp. GDMCC 1.1324]PTL85658.1 cytochrome C [Vitiosangium sp. GDMCC 1.1324]